MNWTVKLSRQAKEDLKYWQKTKQSIFQKCLGILKELEDNPTNLNTTGLPEWLKGKLAGCMSRRITKYDRCVYQVLDEKRVIKVLQLRFHYADH